MDGEAFAFVSTTSPLQASMLQSEQLSAQHEILKTRKTSTNPQMTSEAKAKKDALSLTLSPLPLLMNVQEVTNAFEKIMGAQNVVLVWFHKAIGGRHNGKANVECSNPIAYKQFVRKCFK